MVLDSSAWIEIFNEGPLSKICLKELRSADRVSVPTLVFFEVYKKIASCRSEDHALAAVAALSQHEISDMTREIALSAADISLELKLPMADSLVLAHAWHSAATLVTLDNDFSGIKGTRVIRG